MTPARFKSDGMNHDGIYYHVRKGRTRTTIDVRQGQCRASMAIPLEVWDWLMETFGPEIVTRSDSDMLRDIADRIGQDVVDEDDDEEEENEFEVEVEDLERFPPGAVQLVRLLVNTLRKSKSTHSVWTRDQLADGAIERAEYWLNRQ